MRGNEVSQHYPHHEIAQTGSDGLVGHPCQCVSQEFCRDLRLLVTADWCCTVTPTQSPWLCTPGSDCIRFLSFQLFLPTASLQRTTAVNPAACFSPPSPFPRNGVYSVVGLSARPWRCPVIWNEGIVTYHIMKRCALLNKSYT